jgi:NADPH:quinone reductase
MKAIVITRWGGPEALEWRDVEAPAPTPEGEIVSVKAAAMNFADLMTARGAYGGTPPPPLVAGREFCGLRVSDGKLVMGYTQWGAFAAQINANPELLWPLPSGWSAEEGAACPVNYFTAYLAYWKAGLVGKGAMAKTSMRATSATTRVLIHAVAGGVGTAAVQIGKLLGLEMYGTSSSDEKLQRVEELGLQHSINYKQRDYEQAVKDLTNGEGVDVAFEMLGGEHVTKSVRCLRDFGRVITYGNATGQPATLNPQILHARCTSVHGLWLTYLSRNRQVMEEAWTQLALWTAQGHLKPVIGKVLPMERAREGYELLQNGKNFGKVVLKILAYAG